MKKKLRRRILSVITAIGMSTTLAIGFTACGGKTVSQTSGNTAGQKNNTRQVTDMAGRKVKVPDKVDKVASFGGPSYEMVMLLGQEKKIVLSMPISSKWAAKVYPDVKKISATTSFADPNVEDLINKKIDVVFFWDTPKPLNKMTSSGIPVVVTQKSTGNPDSAASFQKYIKQEVKVFGQVFGEDAVKAADEWCAYFDKKVKYVTSRTSKLSEAEKPKVYYVRGPDALSSHGRNSYTEWYVEMAGGVLVTKDSKQEMMTKPTMEEVLKWNPDVIFMGRVDNTKLILNDPKWSDVKAVKDNKVYVNPEGVAVWDYSSEGVLLLEYIAKVLHPDLFKDLDMRKEIKEYYSKFYHYNLTDNEADRILQHLPPES
ncbi:ABC transporter substrate-binding protein [Clostridium luticellarii]|uniref:Corrinoid ABC transporter substrate-binding protein n=1 Tax=Clostridium luticellarii TaxID=1691940 RepID=A0A2T0BMI1_9CLOT|nr:ABC transporter substrate-binding protein [Clostridium luticellarii]MCI1944977.1 ABC transporter substrate-binding protein [Clostridium luticellarii]MCI1967873.1 ABC transporter substrate-binding protein [Clostridium luticellarii]MCI1995758.1 ABC transporter substrate-binding protein [Clostridium luticellarii]MCI2040733.1 ABC transporter substrate-binding protein [Clostridium luticellarii]PRR85063.1 corrinoid ABC transporter substrate-binding protein [Clostridium luticellarii]